jgi:hypothetical protein
VPSSARSGDDVEAADHVDCVIRRLVGVTDGLGETLNRYEHLTTLSLCWIRAGITLLCEPLDDAGKRFCGPRYA